MLALRLAGFLPAISNPIYAKPMLCVLAYHLVFALGLACRPFVRKKICGVLPMLATWLLALQTLAVLNSCLVLLLNGVLRRLIHLQGSCLLYAAKLR